MRYVIILSLLVLLVGAVQAAEQAPPAKISIQLADLDVEQAFTNLSQMSQLMILGDSTVKGKVNCNLSDVTAEQALDTICKMNNLEWLKIYANPNKAEKLTASKLFGLLDSLKELGGAALICEDATAQTQTVFIPGAKSGSVDSASIATSQSLKPVYLVRAIPDPVAIASEKEKQAQLAKNLGAQVPPADAKAAAQQVWGYFSQMPMDQTFQVMRELRQMMFQNMTPEQMQAMRDSFGNRGPGGGGNGGGQHGQHGGGGGGGQPGGQPQSQPQP